jgi:glycosyltransferase involved in cell wall biosynthesis
MEILITLPSLNDKGGVASYYNSILPFLIQTKDINISLFHIGSRENKTKSFHFITDQVRFAKKISKGNIDIVHVNPSLDLKSFFRDGLIVYQAKQKNIPVLVYWHGWKIEFANKVERFLIWFFKWTFQRADRTIVLADEFKEQLKAWGLKTPIDLGTTAVDESLLTGYNFDKKSNSMIKMDEVKILFLSRIEKAKGIFETLDAFKLLLMKDLNIHLSIAGEGLALEHAKIYSNRIGLPKKKVSFLGYLKNKKKAEAFASHHIYCLPTYYDEGLPASVLEAMAFGLPVITRPVGGLKDFFENKKMGYITKSRSPSKISELIELLLKDRTMLLDMAKYNYQYAKIFLSSKVAEQLFLIYRRFEK